MEQVSHSLVTGIDRMGMHVPPVGSTFENNEIKGLFEKTNRSPIPYVIYRFWMAAPAA